MAIKERRQRGKLGITQKPKTNKLCQPTFLSTPSPLLKKLPFSTLTEKNALALIILPTKSCETEKK